MPKANANPTTNSRALVPTNANVLNPTRRAAFTLTSAAALIGLTGPSPSRLAPPTGALVDITHQFRAAEEHAAHLDNVWIATPRGTTGRDLAEEAFDRAVAVRDDLHEKVFETRPETLADAAVLAGHAFEMAASLTDFDLQDMLETGRLHYRIGQLQTALAGILGVVAREARMPLSDIGWGDLPWRHARFMSRVEARA